MRRESPLITMNRPADLRQVRWLAVIAFAAAFITAWGVVFPYQQSTVRIPEWTIAVMALLAGIIYWVSAPCFRVWTHHLVVVLGVLWACSGLVEADRPTGTAVAFATLLWICVYIAACFSMKTIRIYGVASCVAMALSIWVSGVAGGGHLAFAFALTVLFTMEILGRATNRLRTEASTDPLTGLLNRNGLDRDAAPMIASAASGREEVAIVHVDLDEFKKANDLHGHQEGDRILVRLAESWRSVTRGDDLLARIGGDEFVAVIPGVDRDGARKMVERFREASPIEWSAGLSMVGPGDDLEACLARTDVELYEEKAEKRRQREARAGG